MGELIQFPTQRKAPTTARSVAMELAYAGNDLWGNCHLENIDDKIERYNQAIRATMDYLLKGDAS